MSCTATVEHQRSVVRRPALPHASGDSSSQRSGPPGSPSPIAVSVASSRQPGVAPTPSAGVAYPTSPQPVRESLEQPQGSLITLNTSLAFTLSPAMVPLLDPAPVPRASHGHDDPVLGREGAGGQRAASAPDAAPSIYPESMAVQTPAIPSPQAHGAGPTGSAAAALGDLSLALSSGSELDTSAVTTDGAGDQLQWTI